MKAQCRLFKSHFESWETMSMQVTDFLTELGPDKVIGISQSQEGSFGLITVWYWR